MAVSDILFPVVAEAWLAAAVIFLLLWGIQQRTRDAGVVDVGWAATIGLLAVGYAVRGDGALVQRVLAGVLGGVWGLRLALHLLLDRVIGHEEDGRYRALRAHWGARAGLHLLWFFQAQALAAVVMSLPFLLVASHDAPVPEPIQVAGIALFAVAKLGETVADRQLARFRRRPDTRGRTCREGLWRYSRHPNYFFEWLVWCGFAAVARPAPGGAWALLAPVVMYVLVTRVTGIPYTEAQALRSRGDDYRRYQDTTNAFFPWPPSEAPATGARTRP